MAPMVQKPASLQPCDQEGKEISESALIVKNRERRVFIFVGLKDEDN